MLSNQYKRHTLDSETKQVETTRIQMIYPSATERELKWLYWHQTKYTLKQQKLVTRDTEGHFIMLKEAVYQVQFSCSVVSNSLQPHESQHARPPCPSPAPGVHSDSRPSSQWCHPAISSSVVPFSFPQSLPASEPFPMSQLFAWGGQSTGVSALASFLPKNTQDWSPS